MLKCLLKSGLFLVLSTFLVFNPAVAEEENSPASFPVVDISFAQFATVHARLQEAVEAGTVAAAKGQAAKRIWIELQNQVSVLDTENLKLENEIISSKEELRLKSIRRLSRNSAKRERLIISAYLMFKSITDDEDFECDVTIPSIGDAHKEPDEPAEKKSGIKIELQSTDALIKDLE